MTEKTLRLCRRIKNEGLKKVGERELYVLFNFGSYAYLTVSIYEGLTFDECVYLRSEDIESYFYTDTNQWVPLIV